MLRKKGHITLPSVIIAAGYLMVAGRAAACPTIDTLVDYNCDGRHRIAITGDSIVKGVGDQINNNEGGYVLRLDESLPQSFVGNVGVAGVTTGRLLSLYKRNLTKRRVGTTQYRARRTDLLIIDVGRNDYWEGVSPAITVRNIRRLVKFLRSELAKSSASPPFIVVSTLIPTRRSFQQPFVDEVNRRLLSQRSKQLPVYLRMDKLGTEILSSDGLHPSSEGYERIAVRVRRAVRNRLRILSLNDRPDLDGDEIYDYFENGVLFQTDPTLADTDNDGLNDGLEVFMYFTDPTVADTDGDGISDGDEVAAGTDPLDPNDYPPIVPSPTPDLPQI